jgi:hypothetical protein
MTAGTKSGVDDIVRSFDDVFEMAKKYVIFRRRTGSHVSDIARGFMMGLAEFGSFGVQLYDLDGYPYDDEAHALYSDWETLGGDLEKVIRDGEKDSTSERTPNRQAPRARP